MVEKLEGIPPIIIDLGANHPFLGSNSRIWIEKGWEAYLVEPYAPAFEELKKEYANNPNVSLDCVAVSPKKGVANTEINWHGNFENLSVPAKYVNDVLANAGHQEIGILKVDLDGMDDDILSALDFKTYRPWLVVAEINSAHSDYLGFQARIMRAHGYAVVLHIGNVFYIREDHVATYLFQNRKTMNLPREVIVKRNG
jgi:FkbM family methyltransferase